MGASKDNVRKWVDKAEGAMSQMLQFPTFSTDERKELIDKIFFQIDCPTINALTAIGTSRNNVSEK